MSKLRAWRKSKGLTLKGFATQIGVTVVALARYEAGSRFPRKSVRRKIFEVTGGEITLDDLDFRDIAKVTEDGTSAAA